MIPYGFGQEVTFEKTMGPKLSLFNLNSFVNNKESNFIQKLNPVYEAIKKTRKKLNKNKSLNFVYWSTMDTYSLYVRFKK